MSSYTAKFVETVSMLVKMPRTIPELCDAMEIGNRDSVYRYMRLLRQDGLIYVSGWKFDRSNAIAVWAWQPAVFANPDTPRPDAPWPEKDDAERGPYVPRDGSGAQRLVDHLFAYPQASFTVGELAKVARMSPAAAGSSLRIPLAHGLIEKDGRGKPARYRTPRVKAESHLPSCDAAASSCVCARIRSCGDTPTRSTGQGCAA